MSLANALNTAWMWKCGGELKSFQRATCTVAQTQAAVLQRIVSRNQGTEFGARHGFGDIRNPREFQYRVPTTDYGSYEDLIQRIAGGEENVLTRERVLLLEPTSGSTRGEKLIPYTRSLRAEFQRAVSAWITNLMRYRPAVRCGRAYWSISPAFGRARMTVGGIPIGFDDDTAYLGLLERWAVKRLLAVPPAIANMTDIVNFRYVTLLHLLAARDLALISIWSPTFLTSLIEPLEAWTERICHDLRNHCLSLPARDSSNADTRLCPPAHASRRRSSQLESILAGGESLADKLQQVWPQLALISCWTDAAAAGYVADIQDLFPRVEIQPKGLLATEGCVSFPLVERSGAALALRSHFFEFQTGDEASDPAEGNECLLAHQLSRGKRYRAVLTTSGGLYRYQLHDVVEVVDFENDCPLLKFIGKADNVCDLVGEKLGEPHVRNVLERVFAAIGITPSFALVVPVSEQPPRYRLYLQSCQAAIGQSSSSIAKAVQAGLEENPYYLHAIQLQQLSPLEVCLLDPAGRPGQRIYEQGCLARGQKVGSVKPTALDRRSGWPDDFSQFGG